MTEPTDSDRDRDDYLSVYLSEFVASALAVRTMVRASGLGTMASLSVRDVEGSVEVEVIIALAGKLRGARARYAIVAISPTSELDRSPHLEGTIFASSVVEELDLLNADPTFFLAPGECVDLR